eukprot:CAMPEP_0182488640 /NCGR_PEP_ID=MMETSP1319-20130603/48507_1 /TAXON_ID=172717 /ORGANISM="Bolidomonas pacifica, Strain RCC208" /LENGTH=882 /DNA_ID=CAMNT_0024690765 /DNA_START=121 /DNA_END=2767 /DNA_ORIENTATION=-
MWASLPRITAVLMNRALRALVVVLLLTSSQAKVVEKHVKSVSAWKLVDRFCFEGMSDEEMNKSSSGGTQEPGEGLFKFEATFRAKDRISVSLFFDDNPHWYDSYNSKASEMSCAERQDAASVTQRLWKSNQCADTDCDSLISYTWAQPHNERNGHQFVTVNREFYFRSSFHRWMYVVISNCDIDCLEDNTETIFGRHCQSYIDVDYKFEFRQGRDDQQNHFSADEIGVLPCTQTFFVLQCLNMLGIIIIRGKLMHRRKYHWTVHMLAISIFIHLVSLLLSLVHYGIYAKNGVGNMSLLETAAVLDVACETLFLCLLILLAKGWTIVRRKISPSGRIKIAVFCSLYALAGVFANVWSRLQNDVATVLYIYESPPGTMKLFLRAAAALWFYYAARTTRINFERKKGFYFKFNNFFLFWLLSLPFAIALASSADPYRRFMVYYAFNACLVWLGQGVLLLLYNPSTQFNRSFPFHSHTSSMLGMHGRGNGPKSTMLISSSRSNRRQTSHGVPGSSSSAPPPSTSAAAGRPPATQGHPSPVGLVSSVSGGLGLTSRRSGQIVIKNQFDAVHFLRIKSVSDNIKMHLTELQVKSDELDRILDGITVDSPGQYGRLGYEYMERLSKEEAKNLTLGEEEEEEEEEDMERLSKEEAKNLNSGGGGGGGGGGGAGGNRGKLALAADPGGVEKGRWKGGDVDALKVKSDKAVFEMVERVTSSKSALGQRVPVADGVVGARKEGKKGGGGEVRKLPDSPGRRDFRDRSSPVSDLDLARHGGVPGRGYAGGRGPQSSGREAGSDDEFDHPSLEPPKMERRKSGGPPKGPPPKRRGSEREERGESPRAESRGSSRGDSRGESPRYRGPLTSFGGHGGREGEDDKIGQLEEVASRLK